jgi:hypothetical protein
MPLEIKNKSYNDTTISFVGAGTYTIPLANLGVDITETISSADIKSLLWSTNNSITIKRSYVAAEELFGSGNLKLDEIPHSIANNKTGNIQVTINGGGSLFMQLSKVVGEPATPTEEPEVPFSFTEVVNAAGASIQETNVGPLNLQARATSYQVNPIEDGFIKVNGTTIKTTNLAADSRGHTLAVISPTGATVGTINTYDTFEDVLGDGGAGGRAALTSALNAVSIGNYIVLVSWDACSLDASVRSALTTGYGATSTTTWSATRYSHLFIGKKIA